MCHSIISPVILPFPTLPPVVAMDFDSGASGTYIRKEGAHCLHNLHPTKGPTVILPDHTKIHSNSTGVLPIHTLSPTGAKAHVFNELRSASLLSVGQLTIV